MEKKLTINRVTILTSVQKECETFKIDTIVEKYVHRILHLLPYHCELNPIEQVWSQVKGQGASKNCSFTVKKGQKFMEEAFAVVTAQKWRNYINHAIKKEQKMWEQDNLNENSVETLCFEINCDSSSDSKAKNTLP